MAETSKTPSRNTAASGKVVEIDLAEVFRVLWSNMPALILTMLIGLLAGLLITSTLITPEYSSSTKLYVMPDEQQDNNANTVDNNTLQAGALLTKDYAEIIKSREVAENVISNLQLKDSDGSAMSYDELTDKVNVTIPDGTRVVTISVTDDDPYQAYDIASAVTDAAVSRIQSVMDMKTVKIVEAANIPVKPNGPSKSRNALIGALIGLLLAMAVVIVNFMRNNNIKNSEDVQKYLGLSVLAAIPFAENEDKSRHSKKASRAKAK